MKILYYNPELNSASGGSTHANEVLLGLRNIQDVSVREYPEIHASSGVKTVLERRSWRSAILAFLPKWLRLAREFWIKDYRGTIPDLQGGASEGWVMFIRANSRLRLLKYLNIRSHFVLVCAEVNAIVGEEVPYWLPFRKAWVKWEIRQLDKADLIMVVSRYLKQRLVDHGVPGEKILVNQNGVNLDHFNRDQVPRTPSDRQAWGIPDQGFVFGYVGGMEPFRKLAEVVRTFGDFAKNHPESHLVMIGKGADFGKVSAARDSLPQTLQERVHLTGAVPYDDVPHAMASFDCAIFPFSNPYGSPQKIFEYLAMGLPVLGPDVPVMTEDFENGRHMLLARQDGSDLIGLFERFISDRETMRSMAECGRDLVISQYTWQENARRLHEFLSSHLPR